MIARQLFFTEYPKLMEWGNNRHVPLNINEVTEGELSGYRADVVSKVIQPITVDSILDAAIAEEYTDTQLKRIMRNITDTLNEEVIKYQEFVQYIKESAIAAGYSEAQ